MLCRACRLTGLLEGGDGCLTLTERGDLEPIKRHPNFRLFAAMNPATDLGKKDLPIAVRTRFTEVCFVGCACSCVVLILNHPPHAEQLYVDDVEAIPDLEVVVSHGLASVPNAPVGDIVTFYKRARSLADECLLDGAGQKPRYSLRTLCRVLRFTTHLIPLGTCLWLAPASETHGT